ncbi:glutamate-cysteine ligase-domain-containing protein [Melampsora americana]|nr:glutamate-cysteine ligase-domain-containing protein [Melampsora americana]
MGLLALGTPFDWPECSLYANHVRRKGIAQLIKLWNQTHSQVGHPLLWGDEVEYFLISSDQESNHVNLSLSQLQVLQQLRSINPLQLPSSIEVLPTFHQEYGRFMLESTPGKPYGPSLEDCLKVEYNMRFRRKLAQSSLLPHQHLITLTSFPTLGAPGTFTEPYHAPCGPVAQSLFLPDQIINEHVRFPTLTANIRQRRGSKVAIYLPIYHDTRTPRPFRDPTIPSTPKKIQSPDTVHLNGHRPDISIPDDIPDDHIYLDAMGFGMGCCCLQLTFQAQSVSQARTLYDALVPIAPIMLALSAASPIYKGFLTDVDCRWSVISGAVDDRNQDERAEGRGRLPKSRYDSVSVYIADDPIHRSEYDDIPAPLDAGFEAELLSNGLDRLIARHFAHLFIRDPLVVFSETLKDVLPDTTEHFENIQSTNWQSLRFKPPPSMDSEIGWRVEFRTMEIQITDFENAAYSTFITLLVRAILAFGLNFYIPLSKVDENMKRAQRRDACKTECFYFRKEVYSNTNNTGTTFVQDEYEKMTMNEIMNGKGTFPGLLGVVEKYIASQTGMKERFKKYLDLIEGRASGRLMTTASYLRKVVKEDPNYHQDSVVGDQVTHGVVMRAKGIEEGSIVAEELLGVGYVPVDV